MAKSNTVKKIETEVEPMSNVTENTSVESASTDEPEQVRRGLPKVTIQPTPEQIEHLATLKGTSAKIRYLASEGYSTKENLYSGIANYLGLKYTQHVRNVLTQPLKKA
jgi:hypothetical protein